MSKHEEMTITKYDLLYEQRMTRVESVMENLAENVKSLRNDLSEIKKDMKTDFRWLLGMMIALVGIMAKGFHWF